MNSSSPAQAPTTPGSHHSTSPPESKRGRTRDRSQARTSTSPRSDGKDESRTLRGRSRVRAYSPSCAYPLSPISLHRRLRNNRREHCPSRAAAAAAAAGSPSSEQRVSLGRARSRSRGAQSRRETIRPVEGQSNSQSGLRHEIVVENEAEEGREEEEQTSSQ